MIELEKVLNTLRDQIREYQSQLGKKRMKWEEGAVGIFESVRVFDKNIIGLQEYLNYLGLLPAVTRIDWNSFSSIAQERLMH